MEGLYFAKQVLNYFRNNSVYIYIQPIFYILWALHSMGLYWTSLSICEYRAVIPFQGLVNHRLNFALFINILLSGVLIEQVVEMELSQLAGLLLDVYFVFLLVDFDWIVFIPLLFLWRQEGTHPDGGLNFIRHW